MKQIFVTLFILALCAPSGASAGGAQRVKRRSQKPGVTVEEFEGGRLPTTCGCHLRSPSTGENSTLYVFVSDYTPEKSRRAWVEVDGALKTLRLVSSTEKQGESHKGDSYTEDYRAGDTKVSVRFVVVTPFFPTVEVAEFSAAITVMKGGRSATVEAVGECGCG